MKKTLSEIRPGEKFTYAKREFIALDTIGDGTLAVASDNLFNLSFRKKWRTPGAPNDWRHSDIRSRLNKKFIKELEADGGNKADLLDLNLDLLSLDGLDDYGVDTVKVGILTLDMYRKYRKLIPAPSGWSWLATPWSTTSSPLSSSTNYAHYVGASGAVYDYGAGSLYGVRPALVLSSCLFVEAAE